VKTGEPTPDPVEPKHCMALDSNMRYDLTPLTLSQGYPSSKKRTRGREGGKEERRKGGKENP